MIDVRGGSNKKAYVGISWWDFMYKCVQVYLRMYDYMGL